MLRRRSNALLSVRQVTQRNAGRLTPGVDDQVALTSQARAQLATRIIGGEVSIWKAMPVRRVHIPKSGDRTKLRPLGIPVIMDRCLRPWFATHWSPSGKPPSRPVSTGFDPGAAVMTRSRPSSAAGS